MAAGNPSLSTQARPTEGLGDIEDGGREFPSASPQAHSIISCSRRTDVPANYVPWLLGVLRAEHVVVEVRGHRSDVSLRPADVKAWVWWSKDYGPWLAAYEAEPQLFRRYPAHLFQFTITGLDALERVRASLDERIAQIPRLAAIGHVVVRFDPLTRYRDTKGKVCSNVALMDELIPRFKAAGAAEVVFKFCIPYRPVVMRMQHRGTPLFPYTAAEKQVIVRRLQDLCAAQGLTLKACCPDPGELVPGLQISACVDADTLNALLKASGREPNLKKRKDQGQRKACRCAQSRDIGDYRMSCPHNCSYCYASPATVANLVFA